MTSTTKYPRIINVKPQRGKMLYVTFENGVCKHYDCNPLLRDDAFSPLRQENFFRCARADANGYGVVWNDDIDLAESEVWLNGEIP